MDAHGWWPAQQTTQAENISLAVESAIEQCQSEMGIGQLSL